MGDRAVVSRRRIQVRDHISFWIRFLDDSTEPDLLLWQENLLIQPLSRVEGESLHCVLSYPAFLELFDYEVAGTPGWRRGGFCLPIVRISTSRGIPLSLLGKT